MVVCRHATRGTHHPVLSKKPRTLKLWELEN